ncbi:MAG: HAD-IA family hydrolase [Ectothiorhodospiraceae bacterium]|nr:HAD-IA family hydrolase [Chromatiales bacterium]MCP5154009.1 HAD-IA family hydrolase [Ectothiorhodospiraceae bacterium]
MTRTDRPTLAFDQFTVLTFDVVGTLIDFEAGLTAGVAAIATRSGVGVPPEQALALYGAARRDPEAGPFPDDVGRAYGAVARHFGLPDTEVEQGEMVEAVASAPPFDDSVAALRRLAARYRLVAMTNAQRWAFDRYDRALGNPFWLGFTATETGTEKPDPAYFEHVLARLAADGVRKEQVLHVAQSQYHDIGVAHDLGLTTCWVERRHGRPGYGGTIAPGQFTAPDLHVLSLAELADAVDRAVAARDV